MTPRVTKATASRYFPQAMTQLYNRLPNFTIILLFMNLLPFQEVPTDPVLRPWPTKLSHFDEGL
jgi:hypothetical protein